MLPTDQSSLKALGTTNFGGKVALQPGHSLMDWIRYGNQKGDLSGVVCRGSEVTSEMLAGHKEQSDGWLAIRGRVYNVSPYMNYHPGGVDELMRGVGIDATDLFDEIHKWVNVESLLEKCYVGRLKDPSLSQRRKSSTLSYRANLGTNLNGPTLPSLPPLPPPEPLSTSITGITVTTELDSSSLPTYDWYQTETHIIIVIYTHIPWITQEYVIVNCHQRHLSLVTRLQDVSFFIEYDLSNDITTNYKVSVQTKGKIEVSLMKCKADEQWSSLGSSRDKNNTIVDSEDIERRFHTCILKSRTPVTHDTELLSISLPEELWMSVPMGHHVRIAHTIEGMAVDRSYTAVLPTLEKMDENCVNHEKLVHLMIKIYSDGAVTPWIHSLNIGDKLQISDHEGSFHVELISNHDQVVLFAAGTGFTPMTRLIDHLVNTHVKTRVKLMFFNKTPENILWKDQLQSLEKKCDRFFLHHVMSAAKSDWTGLTGRIRPDLVRMVVPAKSPSSPSTYICLCGPTPFTKEAVRLVKELGYDDDSIHAFLG